MIAITYGQQIILEAGATVVVALGCSAVAFLWGKRKKKMPSPKRTFDLVYACGHSYHWVTRIGEEKMRYWIEKAAERDCGKCQEANENWYPEQSIYGDGEDQISYDSAMYRN